MTAKHAGGRPRKGSLYWTKSGWRARLTIDVDGVSLQKSFDLATKDRAVAKVKLRRLAKQHHAPAKLQTEAARPETFEEAAERIVLASGIKSSHARMQRLKRHVFPALGDKPVIEIVAGDLREILQELAAAGFSKQQCLHVRNDVSSVLGELWRADMLTENITKKVRVPKNAKVDNRERGVLTDEELVRYLGWEHPIESKRQPVRERQTMACVSRMFGGLRTGDILALRWEAFDTAEGAFTRGWAPRKKTARPQPLELPEVLRPVIRDWWERHGRPQSGLIFPVRVGNRAGEGRKTASFAAALRRDLRRAFGVDEPRMLPVVRKFPNGKQRQDTRITWQADARPMTARERELFAESAYTRPLDFHSFRRQFKQSLADAGIDIQTSMALSGATDPSAHRRYLANTTKARHLPEATLTSFSIDDAETRDLVANSNGEFSGFSWCRRADLNRRQRAYESAGIAANPRNHSQLSPGDGSIGVPFLPRSEVPCKNLMLKPRMLSFPAELALIAYLRGLADELADGCQHA